MAPLPVRRSRIKLVAVAVAGSVVTLIGLVLVPLPGPGFLLVAAGLAILATQFAWAAKPLRYARVKAEQGVDEIAKSVWRTAFAVLCGLVPLSIGVTHLMGLRLPVVGEFLNVLIACSLIASGCFLVGLAVYARRRGGIGDEADRRRAARRSAASPARVR